MVLKKLLHSLYLLPVVVIAGVLLLLESDLLWKAGEQNLFLYSWLFFKEQMVVPGGLLSWLGAFFTQFMYKPWLGVTLLAAWWLLLAWLVKRAFRLSSVISQLLAIIPVLFILVTIVDMGYWVYILKLRGHIFVTTIGTTAVAALLWAFRGVCSGLSGSSGGRSFLSPLFVVLTCAVGYPLMGIYALGAGAVMVVLALRNRAWLTSIVAVASVIIVPLVFYRYVYYQINIVNIYFAELPLFFIQEEYHTYYIPYYLLLAFFVILASIKTLPKPLHIWEMLGVGLPLVAAIVFVCHFWNRDENFHRELTMQRCIERMDWEGVVREASMQEDEPTRAIVVMRNIALARLGRQASEMYHYKNGSKLSDAPFTMRMMLLIGPLTYYHYGMPNCCNRLCTEMGVEFGWRVEHLKFMLCCAVLNGERPLARKYKDLLKQTAYYGEWAERVYGLLDRSEEIAKDGEMGFITHLMHYNNYLGGDQGYTEEFIMKQLTRSTYDKDPVFAEQAILASLWTRDQQAFWRHVNDFIRLNPKRQLPVHIQEAIILFGSIEERPNMEAWPFDNSVRESYNRFLEITPQYDGGEVGALRKALYPLFGKTYYYDYYLMSDLPQY